MLNLVSRRVSLAIFGVVLATLAAPAPAWAAGSLAHFAGKGAGYLLVSQGGVLASSGTANPTVTASARKATFKLKCVIGGVNATQTIKLKNGRASIDHLLPGFSGFTASASGRYKATKNRVRATLPFSYSSGGTTTTGTLYLEIETTSFGTALRISSELVFTNGSNPIVMTIFAT